MVFSGKIYDQVKEKLDKYLFGFDKSQLDVSLLKGAIKLQGVNMKPNKAEKFLQSIQMPFSLKAGTVGQLELKMNLMSMFSSSNSMHVCLDNVFLIVGPSIRSVSKDDSYLQESEKELVEPYDENNGFNIFTNNLKLRKKQRVVVDPLAKKSSSSVKVEAETKDTRGLTSEQKDILSGLTVEVKKLHLRFEDDYYAGENPYSFGLVIDEVKFESGEMRLLFDKLGEMEGLPTDTRSLQNDLNQLLKDLRLTKVRLYWNCLSEMYIPSSLWESTRHMKYQIFEAMDAQQLNDLMVQVFTERGRSQFQFVTNDVSVQSQLYCCDTEEQGLESEKPRAVISLSFRVSPLDVRLNAFILNDLHHFLERIQVTHLLRDLKQYRPHRRPITEVPDNLLTKPSLVRKRKLIARDWFFFVVWYIRLKKIIKSFYLKDQSGAYLLFDPKYAELLHSVLDKKVSLQKVIEQIQGSQNSSKSFWPFKNEITVRLESAQLSFFDQQLFEIKPQSHPKLSIQSSKIATCIQLSAVPVKHRNFEEKVVIAGQCADIELSTFHETKTYTPAQPRPLSNMLLRQDVIVQQSQNNRPPTTPNSRPLSSLASAARRAKIPRQIYSSIDNPAILRSQEYGGVQVMHQDVANFPPSTSFDEDRTGLLNPDQERQQMHNLPNMTSPGRLMIGPKVTANMISLGPQQRSEQQSNNPYKNRQGEETGATAGKRALRKSASKDSLMSNMLQSVTKFLSGAAAESEEVPSATAGVENNSVEGSNTLGGGDSYAPPSHTSSSMHGSFAKSPAEFDATLQQPTTTAMAKQNNFASTSKMNLQPTNSQNLSSIHSQMMTSQKGFRMQRANITMKNSVQKGARQGGSTKPTGLESLLKGRSGGVADRAFRSNFGSQMNTEVNHLEMSVIMGSAHSQAGDNEDDIVIDSGGRQINHLNNWQDSYHGNSHLGAGGKGQNQINDGIKNKNFVVSQRDKRTGSFQQSTPLGGGSYSANQSIANIHTPVLSPAQSTLGKLLKNPNGGAVSTFGARQNNYQPKQSNNNLTTRDSQQTARIAHGLSSTSKAPYQTQLQHSQHALVADDVCNVLPSKPVSRGHITTVKERLFKISAAEPGNSNETTRSLHFDYKLVHEKRIAKEVSGEVNLGRVELTYSSNALSCLGELLIKCKELPSFRDLDLVPSCLAPAKTAYSQLTTPQEVSDQNAWRRELSSVKDTLIEFPGDLRGAGQQKARKMSSVLQKCLIDVKVKGERLYISFFDQQSRDQVAKFVSPPVSFGLSIHPRSSPCEANFEVFGFQMQQSTDLNLLGNFTGVLLGQVQMFTSHESIRKGKLFYDKLLEDQRQKEDEKRHITQQIIRRQTKNSRRQLSSGLIDANDTSSLRRRKSGEVPVKKLYGSKSSKPNISQNQAIKPGTSIKKLGQNTTTEALQAKLEAANKECMVGKGLLIEECPSKQIAKGTDDSDIIDLPYPQDDDDVVDDSDDADLKNKHETENSDKLMIAAGLEDGRTTKIERFASQDSRGDGNFGTFLGDTVENGEETIELQDLKSPVRETMHGITPGVGPGSHGTNNSNLREAVSNNMGQAFVQLGGGTIHRNNVQHISAIDTRNLPQSNTHTDSAGGEAFSNQDNDEQQFQYNRIQPKQQVPCDQDEPLLPEPPNQAFLDKFGGLQSPLSNCSDLQVFEDPTIQHNPKNTQKKSTPNALPGSSILGNSTERMKLPPGFQSRLPAGPRGSKSPEESKKWKSTRETQNFSYSNTQKGNIFKQIGSKREQTDDHQNSSSANVKFTPNHLLNFSKQLSNSYGAASAVHTDESSSITAQPHLQKLKSLSSSIQRPHGGEATSPSKKRSKQNSYQSQKQLQEVMKMSQKPRQY